MKISGEAAIDLVNRVVAETNTTDFMVRDFDGARLRIVGSFDLAYYHQLEIIFIEASFISVPTCFNNPVIRMATKEEKHRLSSNVDLDGHVYCIEEDLTATTRKHFVAADEIEAEECMVYYYQRDGLKAGERIELARTEY